MIKKGFVFGIVVLFLAGNCLPNINGYFIKSEIKVVNKTLNIKT